MREKSLSSPLFVYIRGHIKKVYRALYKKA